MAIRSETGLSSRIIHGVIAPDHQVAKAPCQRTGKAMMMIEETTIIQPNTHSTRGILANGERMMSAAPANSRRPCSMK